MPDVLTATENTPADVLKFQRDMLRTGKVQHMGQIWKIVFEATADSNVPDRSETEKIGLVFDFHDGSGCEGGKRPMIGQCGGLMIMESFFKRKDGAVGLPDIPDPAWKPEPYSQAEITGKVKPRPRVAATKRQYFHERCSGMAKGTNLMIFERVAQVLVLPEGLAEGWLFENRANPADGTHGTLLIDRATGEGFFYGGFWSTPVSPRLGGGVTA